jgi:hypothetical protein
MTLFNHGIGIMSRLKPLQNFRKKWAILQLALAQWFAL